MYTRLCAAIARACLGVGIAGLVLLIIAVLYQVIGRYIFNDTPTWAESGAVLLVLYVTMLGMAVGVRDAGHIGLESLLVLAPDNVRRKMELLIHALVGGAGAVRGRLQDPHAGLERGLQVRAPGHCRRAGGDVLAGAHPGHLARR